MREGPSETHERVLGLLRLQLRETHAAPTRERPTVVFRTERECGIPRGSGCLCLVPLPRLEKAGQCTHSAQANAQILYKLR